LTCRSPASPAADHSSGVGDGVSQLLASVLDEAAPQSVLSPIRLPTAAGEVADRLMTAIAVGDFLPGDRIPPERELSTMLGVGRAAVRDAVGRLGAMGLVEIRRGRRGGAFVRTSWGEASARAVRQTLLPRWNEFEQLLDLRALVEELVGRAAAERRTDEQAQAIADALQGFREATTLHEEQLADASFHRAVLAATGNAQLFALSRDLLAASSLGFPYEPWGADQDPGRSEFRQALSDHEAMCQAVTAGDSEPAGKLSREHFTITVDTIRAVLARAQATPE